MTDLERFVPLQPAGTRTPLFCVHAGSGSPYSYLPLARQLGSDQPVYGIEAPGFDDDRDPVRSVHALSKEYAQQLQEFVPDGVFTLLGWSLGGVIAFDLAQRLTRSGARVRQVVLIDVSVPSITELPPERQLAGRFLQEMLTMVGAPPSALHELMASLTADSSNETIFGVAERSGALPAEFDSDLLAERYSLFRAHVEASYGFAVTGRYGGPVLHIKAAESPQQKLSWRAFATDLTELTVPGGHYSLWTGDGLDRLAELVRAALVAAA